MQGMITCRDETEHGQYHAKGSSIWVGRGKVIRDRERGRERTHTPKLISTMDQMTMASLFVYDSRFLMVKIRMI